MKLSFKKLLPKRSKQKKHTSPSWQKRVELFWLLAVVGISLLLGAVLVFSSVLFYRIQNDAAFDTDGLSVERRPRTINREQLENVLDEVSARAQAYQELQINPPAIIDPSS